MAAARRAHPPTPSVHRLRLGLPGYLILFAPLAFAPQRQSWPRRPPSPPVFFQISAHSTATLGIPPSPTRLKPVGIGTPPTYYRGCWHVVSRGFFCRYRHLAASSLLKAVYNPKAFVPHAASLHQAFAHCARFPTAASRRSLGRVSVPIWPVGLSTRLPIIALVGRYPANKLTGRGPIPRRQGFPGAPMRGSRSIRY